MNFLSRAAKFVAALALNIPFVRKHQENVKFVLECPDRVLFKGYLQRLQYPAGVERFIDNVLKIRRMDFPQFAKSKREFLSAHANKLAAQPGAPSRVPH